MSCKPLHPNVDVTSPRRPSLAWSILNLSEYVPLWSAARERPRLARTFARDWFRMPQQHGRLLVLRDDLSPLGTMAMNRIFPKTWMIHHFGVDKDRRGARYRSDFMRLTRELYSAFMYLLHHETDAQYFAIFVEKSKRWNELMYGDFVQRYTAPERFDYTRFKSTSDAFHRLMA